MTNATIEIGGSLLDRKMTAANNFALHHVGNSHTISLPYFTIHLPGWITAHGLMIIIMTMITLVVFGLLYQRSRRTSSKIGGVIEAFVVFVRNEISVKFLGDEWGVKLTPLFCTFFSFILVANVVSLAPSIPSITANLSVTAALAAVTLVFMIAGGIYATGFKGFIKGFMPPGLPVFMQILMLPLEFFSMLIKAFALMIRLFANMMAGHLALFLLAGLTVAFGILAAPMALLVLFVYFMELFFAILQAYIFTLLSAVFIGQRLHPEH